MNGLKRAGRIFSDNEYFILTTHEGPDADGVGAEIVLCKMLGALGKKARIVNSNALQERYAFLDPEGLVEAYDEGKHKKLAAKSVLVVLDTDDEFNTGKIADELLPGVLMVFTIDHHESDRKPRNEGYMDARASSTCELVLRLARSLGAELDLTANRAAYAGIVYDTGSFIYPKTNVETFKEALRLVKAGVVPNEIYHLMYESASVGSLVLQKLVLSTLDLQAGGRIAIQQMHGSDLVEAGAAYEEAESLINIPLKSKEVEVSIFFKEGPDGKLRCSLRSKGGVNVSAIAQSFGGGGHRTAAGFKCPKGLAETKAEVLRIIEAVLANTDNGVR